MRPEITGMGFFWFNISTFVILHTLLQTAVVWWHGCGDMWSCCCVSHSCGVRWLSAESFCCYGLLGGVAWMRIVDVCFFCLRAQLFQGMSWLHWMLPSTQPMPDTWTEPCRLSPQSATLGHMRLRIFSSQCHSQIRTRTRSCGTPARSRTVCIPGALISPTSCRCTSPSQQIPRAMTSGSWCSHAWHASPMETSFCGNRRLLWNLCPWSGSTRCGAMILKPDLARLPGLSSCCDLL